MSAPPHQPQIVDRVTGEVVGGAQTGRFTKARHRAGCTCAVHDTSPRPCPYDGCDFAGRGVRGLSRHVGWAHKRRRRSLKRVLVPDGYGWLTAVLRDPKRAAGLHLESLPRFSQWLAGQWEIQPRGLRTRSRSKIMRTIVAEAADPARAKDEPVAIGLGNLNVPAELAGVIGELALQAGVPVRAIVVALLSYGTEALAKELRATSYAPQPRLPAAMPPG